MKRIMVLVVAGVSLLVVPTAAAQQLSPLCFLTGGGTVNGDSFGGQAGSFRDGSIDGTWSHVTSDGNQFQGDIDALSCQKNGGDPEPPAVDFSIANVSGTGTWNGEPGYTFGASLQDHGEPGAREPGTGDSYHVVVSDADGGFVYAAGGVLDDGNIQIIPTNPGRP